MNVKSFPNALTIVVAFIMFAGLLTYFIPKGKYERIIDPVTKKETVVPNSYQKIEASQLSPFQILTAIPRGIMNGGEVVVLILMVGGCFYIVEKTGALKEGVAFLASKVKGREELALIVLGLLFAAGGAAEGLEEEIIPLIPILLVLTKSFGYPPVIAVGISFGSALIAAALSPVNPFGAVIAQKIAGLTLLDGGAFKISVLIIGVSLWIGMMVRHAKRNRIAAETFSSQKQIHFSNSNIAILLMVVIAFILLVIGMLFWEWGFNEISSEFFVISFIVGIIGKLGINGTFKAYADGFKEMTFAAMIVGIAYSIPLILKEGMVIDTIIYSLFNPLQNVPPLLSALGMMISESILHIVVPSYSGQAVMTIPILAPLSDLIGLSRIVCVMAFQYGTILMNLVAPTNGALMAVIAVAGISYDEWIRFIAKKLLIVSAVCGVAISLATFFSNPILTSKLY